MSDDPAKNCPCPYGERPLGRLYGVSMGRGIVRLSTDPDCPFHNEHPFAGKGEKCAACEGSRAAWIHPESRRRS